MPTDTITMHARIGEWERDFYAAVELAQREAAQAVFARFVENILDYVDVDVGEARSDEQ